MRDRLHWDTVGEPRTSATLRFSGRLESKNRVARVLRAQARSYYPVSAKWLGLLCGDMDASGDGCSHVVRQQYLTEP